MDSYYHRSQKFQHERKHLNFYWWVLIVVAVVVYIIYCLIRPLTPPQISLVNYNKGSQLTTNPSEIADLPWPKDSESAIGTAEYGVLAASSSSEKQLPTASIAKLITALTVLNKFPLGINQEGPALTINQNDINLFNSYFAKDGSLVKVQLGEQLTEYEALEAMMLPSANNIADSLAIWAFGSLPEYRIAAQKEIAVIGLRDTTIGIDASGFDPSTTSTPSDLVRLGQAVMNVPVLKQIVSEKTATIPVAGEIHNTNYLLGSDGFIGIKTGNSDQAGGCLLFASEYNVDQNHPITIIGAIMGDPTVVDAMHNAIPLVDEVKTMFKMKPVISEGQIVANINTEWLNRPIAIVAQQTINLPVFNNLAPENKTTFKNINPNNNDRNFRLLPAGSIVGNLKYDYPEQNQTNLILQQAVTTPNIFWRLTHPI